MPWPCLATVLGDDRCGADSFIGRLTPRAKSGP